MPRIQFVRNFVIAIAALFLASMVIPAQVSAQPRMAQTVSSAYFHQRLAPYGTWMHHRRWGDVWHPRVDTNFRPYLDGHWVYTADYGVIFVSTAIWGDIVYHYGRWVYDPEDGWIWIPGYVWAPAWVVWRVGDGYIGWLPMPPCSNYYGSYFGTVGVYTGGFYDDRYYGYECYQDWYGSSISFTVFLTYWTVIPETRFFAPDLNRWRLQHRDYRRILTRTKNVTEYRTIDNHVVNRSFTREGLDRILRKPVMPVPFRDAVRRDSIVTPVPSGRELERKAGPRVLRDFVPERTRSIKTPVQRRVMPTPPQQSVTPPPVQQRVTPPPVQKRVTPTSPSQGNVAPPPTQQRVTPAPSRDMHKEDTDTPRGKPDDKERKDGHRNGN